MEQDAKTPEEDTLAHALRDSLAKTVIRVRIVLHVKKLKQLRHGLLILKNLA